MKTIKLSKFEIRLYPKMAKIDAKDIGMKSSMCEFSFEIRGVG